MDGSEGMRQQDDSQASYDLTLADRIRDLFRYCDEDPVMVQELDAVADLADLRARAIQASRVQTLTEAADTVANED